MSLKRITSDIGVDELKLKNHSITLIGQSIAGLRSCICVPELDICFDMGMTSDIAIRQSTVCISHGHADHISALHMHAFSRRLQKMKNPLYIMNAECVDGFNIAYKAYKSLNRHVDAKEEHEWMTLQYTTSTEKENKVNSGGATIKSYPTTHGVPSQGYCMFKKTNKLKLEYRGLDGDEIKKLKKSGKEISEKKEEIIVAYTGDSTITGVIQHNDFLNAKVLIMECTYLITDSGGDGKKKDTPEEAKRRGHVHEQDIIDNADKFKNDTIVLTHISLRYSKDQIKKSQDRLQKAFAGKEIIIFDPRNK